MNQEVIKQQIIKEAKRVNEARKGLGQPFCGYLDGTECPVAVEVTDLSESGFAIAKVGDGGTTLHLTHCQASSLSEARKVARRIRAGKLPNHFNW